MDPVNVTVISCLYGSTHDRFLDEWVAAISRLNPAPTTTILATGHCPFIPPVHVYQYRHCDWKYPQAWYLNKALDWVETEWVCISDIDDLLFTDAFDGVAESDASVFQFGFERSDGEIHIPPVDGPINQWVAGSCVRTSAIRHVGGFRDVEHQDSDLWKRLHDAGATFAFSDRPRFYYRRHPDARTLREAA